MPTPTAAVPDADDQVTADPVDESSTRPPAPGPPESIRRRILTRVLPMIALPLLVIGGAAVIAFSILDSRTSGAVADAEAVLTDELAPDTVNSAAERIAQQVSAHLNERAAVVQQVASARTLRVQLTTALERLEALTASGYSTDEELRALLANRPPFVPANAMATLAENMSDGSSTPDVLIVAVDGTPIADSSGAEIRSYRSEPWLAGALANARSITSYVPASRGYQIARVVEDAEGEPLAVIRVRYPLAAAHAIVDATIADNPVEAAIIDGVTGVMLAETETDHGPEYMYRRARLATGLYVNLALLDPTDDSLTRENSFVDDIMIVSARTLAGYGGAASEFGWVIQVRQPVETATAPLADLRAVSDDVGRTQGLLTLTVIGLAGLALILGYRAARSLANRITEPIAHLSTQAQLAASQGIPAVVDAAKSSDEELPELPPFSVDTKDELSVLAGSLNTMQDAAVDLAAGQAQLRRQNVSRTFVSLGRRNQNLINRQLEFITELERTEDDPDTLQNLFRLDHLATRMRRNAENLLVLAGETTPRRWAKPIAVRDVIRAAASEISDYRRVRIGAMDDATVSGNLATDLSHLLAELLENAGTFSPPNSPIDVLGQQTETHYRLAIIDQGIGLDAAALSEANHRLANPVDFSDAPSAYLGLFVVGHLAQRLGITVRLANSEPVNVSSNEAGGTIAFIDLPVNLLSSESPTPVAMPDRAGDADEEPEVPLSTGGLPTWARPTPDEAPTPSEPSRPITAAGFPKRGGAQDGDGLTAAGFPRRGGPAPGSAAAPPAAAGAEKADDAAPADGFPKRVAPMVTNRQAPLPDPGPAPSSPTAPTSPQPVPPASSRPAPPATPPPAAHAPAAPTAPAPPGPGPAAPLRPSPEASPASAPLAPSAGPEPAGPQTAAGFPKRQSAPAAAVPEAPTAPTASTPPSRSPEAVRNSLASFRAAVARGKAESNEPSATAPVDAPEASGPSAQPPSADPRQPRRTT